MKKNRERAESKSMNYRLDIEYDGSRYEAGRGRIGQLTPYRGK